MSDARETDMHFRNAAAVLGVPVDEVTPEQRRLAKACAFGAPSETAARENLRIALGLGLAVVKDGDSL